jgi:putative ABC transport system permease protein
MFKNYFKIAFRNLLSRKLTSFINLFGLTLGLTCCFAIISYTLNELSYDKHHKLSDRIYRVVPDWKWDGQHLNIANTSGPMAPLLKENFPEIEQTVRFSAEGSEFVKSGTNTITISPIFTEESFFKIFDHTFLYGDPKTALSQPNSMILSESAAIRIFGSIHKAYGKTLEYINRPPQKVTGIIKDLPSNSHLTFDAVGALEANADYLKQLHNLSFYTYVVIKPGTDIIKLEAKTKQLMAKVMNYNKADYSLRFQALTSIHLHSQLQGDFKAGGSIQYLYIFSIIGFVILALACINYINLTTAQSTRRAKEVGVRKVMGSNRTQLILQFFIESFILVLIASVLSLLLLKLITPFLSQIGSGTISLFDLGWKTVSLSIIGMALIVSLFSGLYPAIFLSKFNTSTVLKGTFIKNPSHGYFRKSLVVVQFSISIALIVFTLISWQQLNFVMTKDLGFNKDQVLGLRIPQHLRTTKLSALKNKLNSYPGIISTTSTTNQLGLDDRIPGGGFFLETNGQKPTNTILSQKIGIDTEYLSQMEITLKEGRNFSSAIKSDSTEGLIVNQTLVRNQGWKNPIGKRIWSFTDDIGNTKEARVIGVVKDFHATSLHKAIEPLVFFLIPPHESDNLYIKIKPGSIKESLAYIEQVYKEFDNYNPYEIYFLDQNFASQYQADTKKRNLFMLFASLAILIACLGLFGLAAFTVIQRTKEIGIRKVLGASIKNVVILVLKEFTWLIVIAFLIAAPIAWWGVSKWLQDFAYQVEIHWWIYLVAGSLTAVIALVTVGLQAVKAALANPVKSLRAE